ncbi:hypothetical protein GEV43_06035 [Actinomadura sp. J1-007]|uniref:hypothetical protein n=1 Tax=Actinomadura sp. J1-007 TaxID=2661913 RepID=UPI0013226089|nr:hypothetical protein [Actinomadura sp. J1-007]MWK33645.1 hypothetical protein [Actinomadura sp. J1-007]
MGAEPWTYFVPFQEDIAAAMSALREREFADVLQSTDWPDEWRRPTSIEDYRNLLDETASNDNGILELDDRLIGPGGEDEYRAVRLLASEEVRIFFGTDRPTRNDFERTYASASTGRHYNAFPSQPSLARPTARTPFTRQKGIALAAPSCMIRRADRRKSSSGVPQAIERLKVQRGDALPDVESAAGPRSAFAVAGNQVKGRPVPPLAGERAGRFVAGGCSCGCWG